MSTSPTPPNTEWWRFASRLAKRSAAVFAGILALLALSYWLNIDGFVIRDRASLGMGILGAGLVGMLGLWQWAEHEIEKGVR